jgi:hypothetical protein
VAKSHKFYQQANVSLPDDVEIRIPASDLSLSIEMGTVEINTLGENPQLWAMPTKPGVPLTDLGASQANAATPRMGDQITDANWYGPGPAVGQVQAAGVPMSIPVAPATAGLATMAPPMAATQRTGPAPQFIHPSGVELPAASVAQQQSPYPAMQQLPAAGVAGSTTFTR